MPNLSSEHDQIASVANGASLVEYIADVICKIRERALLSRILVIVPSSYSAFFLKRAVTSHICEYSSVGIFNVEFMRIRDVADILFDAISNSADKPTLSDLIGFELIHNAITNMDTPGPLSEHAENDSTIAAVQRTLRELDLLSIGAEEALSQISASTSAGIYAQLLEVQRDYSRNVRSYITSEEKCATVAAKASDDPEFVSQILAPDIIVVRAPAVPDVHTDLLEALQQNPATKTINISPSPRSNSKHSDSDRLTHFYSTMGAADEPRALIRNIVSDARDGINFGEMAVFYPSSDYASRIKDAFNDAGIPNCGPSTRTLAETPAGKFVSQFLVMVSEDMRRDTFTSWTNSSPVMDPSTGERVPAVSWEVSSRNAKISRFSGETDWAGSLERYARRMYRRAQRAQESDDDEHSSGDPDSLYEAARHSRQLLDYVNSLIEQTRVEHLTRWSQWATWLDDIISDYLPPASSSDDAIDKSITQITNALNQVRKLDDVTRSKVDFAKFARTVQRLLRANIGASSGWGSSVLIAPLSAGIGTAFKTVHILGMSEGSLPRPGRHDPLLSDSVRRQLDPEGSKLLIRSDHLDLDQFTFQMALSCAPSNRLYWNKALMGATNETYPSPWFVDEVQKSNNQTSIPVKTMMDPENDYIESVTPLSEIAIPDFSASSRYEFGLRDVAIRAQNVATRSQLLSDASFEPLATGNGIARSRKSDIFGHFAGNVVVETTSELETSASALEGYATCPYRYFLAHELNVDERIDPEESLELSPVDKGILVHKILEEFLKNYGADQSQSGLEALRLVAQTEIDRYQSQEFVGYNAIFDLEKANLIRDLEIWHDNKLDALVGYGGKFRTEESFGRDGSEFGRIPFDDDFSIRLSGQIDLIAISSEGDHALVIDFKTGRRSYTSLEKDITDAGQKLQLPIYSIVATQILGETVAIEAAFWFVFLSGANEFRPKNYATLEESISRFQPVISTIVAGIRKGTFPARPGKRLTYGNRNSWENCRYCPYDNVCTSDRLIAWDRNKTADQLQDYVALAEG